MKILTQTRRFSKPNNSRLRFRDSGRNYYSRLRSGHRFEDEVKQIFKSQFGINLNPCGLEYEPDGAKDLLTKLDDKTSRFIRFLPDFYTSIPDRKLTFFVEVKSSLTNTDNYSVNKSEYDTQYELTSSGCLILYVFPALDPFSGLRAEWLINLNQNKVITVSDSKKLRQMGGSGKPFVLVPKRHTRPLRAVMDALLKEGFVW